MKRILLIAAVVLGSAAFVSRSPQPYRVAFDLTSRDSLDQKAVLRWINEITTSNPEAELEVVMYGKGFELVMPERSPFTAEVQAAMKKPHVTFKVCAIALKNNNVRQGELYPAVQLVPDGIRELVERQQDHWGYIKVGH